MELKFVLGKSGSGKTTYCIDKMLSLPTEKKVIYIVPEQFTLESEKLLTARRKSLINIDVVSFRRLRYHIEAEIGKISKEFLDDESKAMIIRKLISEEDLIFFEKAADKAGFLERLGSIISEFYRFGITPEVMSEKLSGITETEQNISSLKKLKELAYIYKKYNDYISEKYISSDQLLDYIAESIKKTTLFEGTEVFIDGFNSFTKQEYNVIREIMAYAGNTTVALCLSKPVDKLPESTADPFYEAKKAYVSILGIFTELFPTDRKVSNIITDNSKNRKPVFDFLEKNFFSFYPPIYGRTDDIELLAAVNKKAEAEAVCDRITEAVRDRGLRYRDIAVVLCDKSYMPLLRSELKKRKLPDFTDSRIPILSHICPRFIISLINIVAYGFRSADVFAFPKTDLTRISPDKTARLEKYVIERGIDRYRWEREFSEKYFEDIRKMLMDMTAPLREGFSPGKEYPLSDISKALFDTIEKTGFYGIYKGFMEETDDAVLSSRYKLIWEQVVSTFDKAEEFLGDSLITLEAYSNIITTALAGKTVATIPLYQDNIIIGDIERSRYPAIKEMYVLGAVRGALPKRFDDVNIIDDNERELLRQNGIETAADTNEQLSLEYLKIYQILTKPTEKLCLSFPKGTAPSGEEAEVSEIAERLKKMFKIQQPVVCDLNYEPPENTEPFEPVEEISHELTDTLLGDTLYLSSSRIDSYSKCPFSYFLSYILKLKEDRLFEINAMDKGNILHGIMERFFEDNPEPGNMTEEEINRRIGALMPEVLSENIWNLLDEDKKIPENLHKLKYFCRRLEKTADTSVLASVKQLKRGRFVPFEFEVAFGGFDEGSLPPVKIADDILLVGKIDRVDLYEENDKVYVKVTDYKSSSQTMDMKEIYNGLKLQLLLYLSAYTEEKQKTDAKGREYHPGGLMYFAFKNPKKNFEPTSKKKERDIRFSDFRPTGFVTAEAERAFDSDTDPTFEYMKDMESLPEKDFVELMGDARKISDETGRKIKSGHFPVKPYVYSGRHGCDYCPYSGICEIDIDPGRCNKIQ